MTAAWLMPDISSNNGQAGLSPANARKVAKVARAIMVKATEDDTYTFAAFRSSIANAKAAGLETAAYHFVGTSPGKAQARHFWATVKGSGVTAVCIDWEGGSRRVALALHKELKILAGPHGVKVGAYEGSWAREHGGGLPGCDFTLIPAYGGSTLNPAYKQTPYAGWQYTNGVTNGTRMPSSIPGIGHCDVSVIERPELLGFKVAGKPVPTPDHPKPAPKPAVATGLTLLTRHAAKAATRALNRLSDRLVHRTRPLGPAGAATLSALEHAISRAGRQIARVKGIK